MSDSGDSDDGMWIDNDDDVEVEIRSGHVRVLAEQRAPALEFTGDTDDVIWIDNDEDVEVEIRSGHARVLEEQRAPAWKFTGDRASLPRMRWSEATMTSSWHKPQLPDKPSGTVLRSWSSVCVEAHVLDPIRKVVRRLTVPETAAIQGFSKQFFDISGLTTCQKMRAIGNAVPPPLGEVVLGSIHSVLGEHMTRRTFIDLCAGTGGLTACLYSRGYSCSAYIDMEPSCCHILRHYHPASCVFETVIESFPWAAHAGKIDILAGGPPCQPWSNAGRKRGENDSREVMQTLPGIIHDLRPVVFCFENVAGLTSSRNREFVQAMRVSFETDTEGNRVYAMGIIKLNAADYGVPQNRRRVFVIGVSMDAGGDGALRSIMSAIEGTPKVPRPVAISTVLEASDQWKRLDLPSQ